MNRTPVARRLALVPALALVAAWALAPAALAEPRGSSNRIDYPQSRRVDHVDTYHGTAVPDPYRWLEADVRTSAEAAAWVDAQNAVTRGYLEAIPERQEVLERLTELWDYERYSTPFKAGGRYFYFKNDGLQDQSVLHTMDALAEDGRVLLDPNAWSDDGTVALRGLSVSDDGAYLAYGVGEAGSDWSRWHVMEIDGGEALADELRWIKFSGASWSPDSLGFFYTRFEEPAAGTEYQSLNFNMKVYYHRVGTDQSRDVLVHHRPDHPEWNYFVQVTEDGRYLVITVFQGTDSKYRVLYKDLREPYGMTVPLIDRFENEYSFVGNDGPLFYFTVDVDAPRKRLVTIDVRAPERERWREIVPESEDTLQFVSLVGNLFVASYLDDAKTQVRIFDLSGAHVRDVDFPTLGSAFGFGGERTQTETFYVFASFATPPSIYRYDLITGESTLLRRAQVDFRPEDYEVSQVFYTSKDGTKVPMFVSHRKGIELDGTNPTLLYGYGGFSASMTPFFSTSWLAWMEMGGVLAMPNLRGGGEYGEQWHQAGTRLNKQNVFDDFIAAAEWLVAGGYTRPDKLAVQGGSNGGLLVGAVLTQRPDLFGAALPAVGVLDMLRFHTFTAGRYWVDDYGSSEDPEEFRALLAYSPYHNVKKGTKYPATLITTADHDDRVVPAHSFKFAAALQHAQAGEAPVLIRVESRAGHGGGTPTSKVILQTADQWAFLVDALEMEVAEPLVEVPQAEGVKGPRG
jgi:prolyl oligopeptidase